MENNQKYTPLEDTSQSLKSLGCRLPHSRGFIYNVEDTMTKDNGWIKLHRTLFEWEWYSDIKTFRLFIHLLLRVNHEPKYWKGKLIKRGQTFASHQTLARETGLTVQNIRTSFNRLESTKELTRELTSKGQFITILNYDKFQSFKGTELTSELTNNQQATNRQLTTNKNDKNDKNLISKEEKEKSIDFIIKQNPEITEELQEFVKMRKSIRKAITTKGLELIVKKLNKLSQNKEIQKRILEQSIENSWQGVFELKTESKPINNELQKWDSNGNSI